jgi:hypothetical protein
MTPATSAAPVPPAADVSPPSDCGAAAAPPAAREDQDRFGNYHRFDSLILGQSLRLLPLGRRFGFCSHIEAALPKISCS